MNSIGGNSADRKQLFHRRLPGDLLALVQEESGASMVVQSHTISEVAAELLVVVDILTRTVMAADHHLHKIFRMSSTIDLHKTAHTTQTTDLLHLTNHRHTTVAYHKVHRSTIHIRADPTTLVFHPSHLHHLTKAGAISLHTAVIIVVTAVATREEIAVLLACLPVARERRRLYKIPKSIPTSPTIPTAPTEIDFPPLEETTTLHHGEMMITVGVTAHHQWMIC